FLPRRCALLHLHSFPTPTLFRSFLALVSLLIALSACQQEDLENLVQTSKEKIQSTINTDDKNNNNNDDNNENNNDENNQHPLTRSEEHTSELQSRFDLVCRLLLE